MAQVKDDFWSRYSKLCLKKYKIYPSKNILKNLKSSDLSCIVETIRSEQWKPILVALAQDSSLTKVHLASCVSPHEDEDEQTQTKMKKQRRFFPTPYGRTQKNIRNITLTVGVLLQRSQTLTILKLENLTLKLMDAGQLANGLSRSCSLRYLSLSGCHLEDGVIPIVCKSLHVSYISWIDFSCCALSVSDVEAVGNLIKFHCIRRRSGLFPSTLRSQTPEFEELPGLNRISLNYNSIEDKALNFLIESMSDDLWVKALDLQNCDIDTAGAVGILNLAATNTSLVIIDLRLNQIEEPLLSAIANQLEQNKATKEIQLMLEMPLWTSSELVKKYNLIGKPKTSKKPAARKFKISKKFNKSFTYSNKSFQTAKEKRCRDVKDASSQTPSTDVSEILRLVKDLRHRLQNEVKLRKYLLAKYRQVHIDNVQLRQLLKNQNDDIYVDQETFFDVKHTFEKLKVFFDVMKKYGLWEYISMLGFDESTDVILEETNSQKCMRVVRDETYIDVENPSEFDREVCCNCRKLDYKHRKMEPPDDEHNCTAATSTNSKIPTKEDPINEKITYKVLQEAMNDHSNGTPNQVLNSKPTSGKMTDNANLTQDNPKLCGSKPSSSASSNTTTGAQMLIKKFSYSNMPKQLKELVSPTDFYNIVKKELERCENEAQKPYNSLPAEHYESSSSGQPNPTQSKQNSYKIAKCRNEVNAPSTSERKGSFKKLPSKVLDEEDRDNISISELIAREKAANRALAKKEVKPSVSSLSNSKVNKNANHAKIKETKSLSRSEETLPRSKLKLSSSQTNSMKYQSNASSDEINSSDSVVTASDKASSHSSVSSSSSNKSYSKSFETLSDASTFKEIESIIDAEVTSDFPPIETIKEKLLSLDEKTDGFFSSHSSFACLLKGSSESKSNKSNSCKSNESVVSGASSVKDSSKKSDKSAKTNVQTQGKTKNANKHNKNRPKNNSSKSSSIPSLSDITTVSSKSLNTDSVLNQISGSDDGKSKGKK